MISGNAIDNSNKSLSITISGEGMEDITLNESDIQNSSSLTIDSKTSSDSSFELGSVYAAQCEFSFRTNADRYKLYNMKVSPVVSGGGETLKKGVYYIADAQRTNDYVKIKAYDGMILLDKEIEEDTLGNVPDLMSLIALKCDIELAQTSTQLKEFTNGNYQYSVKASAVGTYRVLLSCLAKLTCTFAVFDNNGKLKLCKFNTDSTNLEIKNDGRTTPEVSDFTVKYDSVKVRVFSGKKYKKLKADNGTKKSRYDFGDIPLTVPSASFEAIVNNMLTEVVKISYVPVSMSIKNNPYVELGDSVKIKGVGKDEADIKSYVMDYKWSFRGLTQIKSVGTNPFLAGAKTKTENQLNIAEDLDSGGGGVVFQTFTNASRYNIASAKETEIIRMNVTADSDGKVMFMTTIPYTMTLDGNVIFKYYLDSVLLPDDTVEEYRQGGKAVTTLIKPVILGKSGRGTVSLTMQTAYFESKERKQDTKIEALKDYIETGQYNEGTVDETPPTAAIEVFGIKAVIFGNDLVESAWDGTIIISEEFEQINITTTESSIEIASFTEQTNASRQTPSESNVEQGFSVIEIDIPASTISIVPLQETLSFKQKTLAQYVEPSDVGTMSGAEYIDTSNNRFEIKTEYSYIGQEEQIDEGKFMETQLPLADFDTVESVVIS